MPSTIGRSQIAGHRVNHSAKVPRLLLLLDKFGIVSYIHVITVSTRGGTGWSQAPNITNVGRKKDPFGDGGGSRREQ